MIIKMWNFLKKKTEPWYTATHIEECNHQVKTERAKLYKYEQCASMVITLNSHPVNPNLTIFNIEREVKTSRTKSRIIEYYTNFKEKHFITNQEIVEVGGWVLSARY